MPPTFARTRTPPPWFRAIGVLFLVWGMAGVYAFYSHATLGPAGLAALPDYDRRFWLARPGWFDWVYAAATWGGLLGSALMLAGRRWSAVLFGVSLMAVAVQFGWVFAATDLIAAKGALATVPFPLVIFIIALLQLAIARRGVGRHWLR
ncbi:hypothetical protein [Sphingomonas sp. CFBP 13720]|uniref:hypothetical protein n=1 Tax=Sphingomonas sp. CFBP 13720 TaxID=2775302 RepID=UPI00177BA223|nr:hypothetical protein [Sphingomonas sp. CFBP 13720]MBD8677630.1 hypothetical protein [Sphingomonas sp. CFBP 13720]